MVPPFFLFVLKLDVADTNNNYWLLRAPCAFYILLLTVGKLYLYQQHHNFRPDTKHNLSQPHIQYIHEAIALFYPMSRKDEVDSYQCHHRCSRLCLASSLREHSQRNVYMDKNSH